MNFRPSFVIAMLLAPAAFAGTATVSNTGSVTIDDTTYTLWGIDSPPPAQTCANGWKAGQLAQEALAGLIEGKTVTCEARDKDRSGRTLAVCKANGVDLGEALVKDGMAWARLGVSKGYVVQEAQAASLFRGLHNHHCEQPDVWRSKNAQFQRDETGGGTAGN